VVTGKQDLRMGRDTQYDVYKKNKSSSLKKIRHFFEFVAILSFQKFAGLWSFKQLHKLGALFGRLALKLADKDRGIAEYQLDFCFPELSKDQRKELLKRTFEDIGKTFFEALITQEIRKNPASYIRLINPEIVKKALEEGNGAVMLFGHVGNWELLPAIYEMLGITGIAVESPVGDNKLDDILLATRASDNIKMVPRGDRSSARSILKCFRNNEVFLFAMDQDTRVKSVYVDFFGKKASTAIGAAVFAQKFNTPVISAFGARQEDGMHQYTFELLSKAPYQGGKKEVFQLTQNYTSQLEKHIRLYPSQWVWFHRRWKNQPDDEENKDGLPEV